MNNNTIAPVSHTDAGATPLNAPVVEPRLLQNIALETVELYPYIEYMKYLLPGSITLAMFVSVMIAVPIRIPRLSR